MKLNIYPNYFAPKVKDFKERLDEKKSHAIYCIPCNYKCKFCKKGIVKEIANNDISLDEFDSLVKYLITRGNLFKITGGEPTLLPELKDMLSIIKKNGGIVFLDTNASNYEKVNDLVNENLVDVLGISIKGLDSDEAFETSGVPKRLCWDSNIKVIENTLNKNVQLIVTYVAFNSVDTHKLIKYLDMLESYNPNAYFKINNLYGDIHRDNSIRPLDLKKLNNLVEFILKKRPQWKGRLIIIESFDSVQNFENIKFF